MLNVLEKLEAITTFVFDMDGVLTDGSLIILSGNEYVRTMDIKDGYALQLAVKKGYRVVVISGSESKACAERLRYLGIEDIYMKVKDKEELLAQYILHHGIGWEQILYMGDDIPDREVMRRCGVACAPADAATDILAIADYITRAPGGKGAVREVLEKVLRLQRRWVVHATDAASQ